jgi:hypothetical protein
LADPAEVDGLFPGAKSEIRMKEDNPLRMIRLLTLLVIVLFAFNAPAEIYKYLDDQGNVHFTDDINQVPEDQRDSMESSTEYSNDSEYREEYAGSESGADSSSSNNDDDTLKTDPELESSYADEPEPLEGFEDDEGNQEEVASVEDSGTSNSIDAELDALDAERKRLRDLKRELDKEYKELVEEQKELKNEEEKLITREDKINFNAKVDSLNKRAEAYIQKGKQYKEQEEAYNQRVIQINSEMSKRKK